MKFTISQVYIAIMAATALALPVDVDQHPMAIASDMAQERPAAKVEVAPKKAAPQPAAPAKVESSPTSDSDDLLSALKAIFGDEAIQKEGLGRGCFCANGSICCNTSKGIDCTQGLCGI